MIMFNSRDPLAVPGGVYSFVWTKRIPYRGIVKKPARLRCYMFLRTLPGAQRSIAFL